MKARSTPDKLHLTLDRDEALALMSVLGVLHGETARRLPWYDQIADALEVTNGILRHTTISEAVRHANFPEKITVHPLYIAS